MNVTASAGIAPAWTATKPTPATVAPGEEAAPADQPAEDTAKETAKPEAAEKRAESRRAPEGQGMRIDVRV